MSKVVPGDSRKTTLLDRISKSYDTGKALKPAEEATRQKLEEAYSLLVKHPRSKVVKMLGKKFDVGKVTANKYVNDSLQLFGEVMKSSRQGERQIIVANLERLAKKAEQAGEYDVAIKAHTNKAKVLGLDREDEIDLTDKIQMPSIVIFTTDPNSLPEIENRPYEPAE